MYEWFIEYQILTKDEETHKKTQFGKLLKYLNIALCAFILGLKLIPRTQNHVSMQVSDLVYVWTTAEEMTACFVGFIILGHSLHQKIKEINKLSGFKLGTTMRKVYWWGYFFSVYHVLWFHAQAIFDTYLYAQPSIHEYSCPEDYFLKIQNVAQWVMILYEVQFYFFGEWLPMLLFIIMMYTNAHLFKSETNLSTSCTNPSGNSVHQNDISVNKALMEETFLI